MLLLSALLFSTDSVSVPRRISVSSTVSGCKRCRSWSSCSLNTVASDLGLSNYGEVVRTGTTGKELAWLCLHFGKQFIYEEDLQTAIGNYGSARMDFIPSHSGVGLFPHRGALSEAGDVAIRVCSDLVRWVYLERECHHISVRAKHFEPFGTLRHRTFCESDKQV